ncbi:uncharacterized protein LTR77_004392 [Saxophila tyrrhenica]|uniref:Uncharacterized protein n=1 Tax=Saxophila tyrrhenica TaxID=1690608 RepID=A0AAV9PGJ6_9PEZI|nr:hypothetical protein LTR77_004392 [Saxophila tyrrhenica]
MAADSPDNITHPPAKRPVRTFDLVSSRSQSPPKRSKQEHPHPSAKARAVSPPPGKNESRPTTNKFTSVPQIAGYPSSKAPATSSNYNTKNADPVSPIDAEAVQGLNTRITAKKGATVTDINAQLHGLQRRCREKDHIIHALHDNRRRDEERHESDREKLVAQFQQEKQDMVLDFLIYKDKCNQRQETFFKRHMKTQGLLAAKETASKQSEWDAEQSKVALSTSSAKVVQLEAKCTRLTKEKERYKSEADSYIDLNATLEADLDSLRALDNEEAARRDKYHGLPPNYDDVMAGTAQPPWKMAKDGGLYDIALLKSSVRKKFDAEIRLAYDDCERMRALGGQPLENSNKQLFCAASEALRKAAVRLRTALMYSAKSMRTVDSMFKLEQPEGSTSQRKGVPAYVARSGLKFASQSSCASRVAKLLLDFTWRVISATELRPGGSVVLSDKEQTTLGLGMREVDDVLLEAIRTTLSVDRSDGAPVHRAYEFQNWLLQVSAVKEEMETEEWQLHYKVFNKTETWLNEQVEQEREGAANR